MIFNFNPIPNKSKAFKRIANLGNLEGGTWVNNEDDVEDLQEPGSYAVAFGGDQIELCQTNPDGHLRVEASFPYPDEGGHESDIYSYYDPSTGKPITDSDLPEDEDEFPSNYLYFDFSGRMEFVVNGQTVYTLDTTDAKEYVDATDKWEMESTFPKEMGTEISPQTPNFKIASLSRIAQALRKGRKS